MIESWSAHILSHTTFEETAIPGMPLFSPGKNQFVTLSMDLEAGYRPNILQVLKIENNQTLRIILEKNDYPEFTAPQNAVWTDNNKLDVTINAWNIESGKINIKTETIKTPRKQ